MIGGTALPKITRKGVLRGPGGLGSNPSRDDGEGWYSHQGLSGQLTLIFFCIATHIFEE